MIQHSDDFSLTSRTCFMACICKVSHFFYIAGCDEVGFALVLLPDDKNIKS